MRRLYAPSPASGCALVGKACARNPILRPHFEHYAMCCDPHTVVPSQGCPSETLRTVSPAPLQQFTGQLAALNCCMPCQPGIPPPFWLFKQPPPPWLREYQLQAAFKRLAGSPPMATLPCPGVQQQNRQQQPQQPQLPEALLSLPVSELQPARIPQQTAQPPSIASVAPIGIHVAAPVAAPAGMGSAAQPTFETQFAEQPCQHPAMRIWKADVRWVEPAALHVWLYFLKVSDKLYQVIMDWDRDVVRS